MAYPTFCYATQTSDTSATMRLHGEIGYDVSSRIFLDELAYLETNGVTDITVHIHSVGGSVVDGFGIFTALLNSKANITTMNEGLAASTAGWLLCAGKTVKSADYALLMVHNPMTYDASPKAQEVCSIMRQSIITILAARSGNTPEAVSAMMDEETWLTADRALAAGFITEIVKTEAIVALAPQEQTVNTMYQVVNSALKLGAAGFTNTTTPETVETPETPRTVETPTIVEAPEVTSTPEVPAIVEVPEVLAVVDADTQALLDAEAALEAAAEAERAAAEVTAPAETEVVAETVTNSADLTSRVLELEALVKSYQDKEAAIEAETVRNVATTMVKNAITAGRIEATAEATWVNLAIANPELARTTLDALKPQARNAVNVLAQAQTAAGATNSAGQLSLRELEKKNPAEVARLKQQTPEVYNQLYFNQYGVYPK
ncbi:Clp protease ClpP [Hymenobacter terrenus]|uniref:Clp protease ClpP n=1 Tax=Hymenobacter terrenus TaxID=1629124 RepID=UPI000698863B|nr:Clp protease ClpP [Hymenobacter terrenus]